MRKYLQVASVAVAFRSRVCSRPKVVCELNIPYVSPFVHLNYIFVKVVMINFFAFVVDLKHKNYCACRYQISYSFVLSPCYYVSIISGGNCLVCSFLNRQQHCSILNDISARKIQSPASRSISIQLKIKPTILKEIKPPIVIQQCVGYLF